MAIKVNRSDIIKEIARKHGIPFTRARDIVNDVFRIISREVADGNAVHVAGFGKFFLKHKRAHPARHISAGETINLPERDIPVFVPADSFKYITEINGGTT